MKVTADTNILVRSVVRDDPSQTEAADRLLRESSSVAVPLQGLCEFVWVLDRVYGLSIDEIAYAVERLINAANVVTDMSAAGAGLAALRGGADFADGVIAYEGGWHGGETFISFDRRAVSALAAQGFATRLLR